MLTYLWRTVRAFPRAYGWKFYKCPVLAKVRPSCTAQHVKLYSLEKSIINDIYEHTLKRSHSLAPGVARPLVECEIPLIYMSEYND